MQCPCGILRIATLRVKAASKPAVFTLIAASRNRYTRAWTFCISKNTSQPQIFTIQILVRSFIDLPVLQYPAHASLSQFLSVQLPLLKIPRRKHSPSSIQRASDPQHDVWPLLVVQGVSGERVPSGK